MTARDALSLYAGTVVHRRARPKRHALRYRVFSMLADVDRLDEADANLRWFSRNRFNLFSLNDADFGVRDGRAISDFIWGEVSEAGLRDDVIRIDMLAYPRIFGFAFNPITVYFAYDRNDAVRLIVYEVSNTFGERHHYVAGPFDSGSAVPGHEAKKAMHVSPFNVIEGRYRFSVRQPGEKVFVGVTLGTTEGGLVTAFFDGERRPGSDFSLLQAALAYPFVTIKVVLGIHWEALKLWLKGVPLRPGPKAGELPAKTKAGEEPRCTTTTRLRGARTPG